MEAYEWPSLGTLFAPPPVVLVPAEYDGFELRFKRFTFRPTEFKTEGIIVAVVALYLAVYYLGKRINSTRSYAWIKAHSALYTAQFATPFSSGEVLADGASDLAAFSTGRRGLYSLHTTFTLLPRHDLIQQLYIFIRSSLQLDWVAQDEITLDFNLRHGSAPGFVWAIVNKDELKNLRANRFDVVSTQSLYMSAPLISEFSHHRECSRQRLMQFLCIQVCKL